MNFKLKLVGIEKSQRATVKLAIRTANALIWGGRLHKYASTVEILKNSSGDASVPELLRGLSGIYDKKTRKITLSLQGLIGQGEDSDSNLAWSICHDLAHVWDVVHGNLSFKSNTLIYMGREYDLKHKATTVDSNGQTSFSNFRGCVYYAAHDYWEPWEAKALILADACSAHMRRSDDDPNWLKKENL